MKSTVCLPLLISCTFLLNFSKLKSQSVVYGSLIDVNGKGLQSANVLLLNSSDSSLVKGMISDASGKYSFENIKNGKYFVTATFSGMNQEFTQIFEIIPGKKEINAGILYMKNADAELKNVTVAAKKLMYEQRIDRMIINVKNSITNAGGTALDILEKSPGVTVNRQNNSIAVNGKNGVVVMINNKITYLPLDALVQMLAGISAGNIEKIELITTPPSKYDAAGNAGYINIVLINNPYAGFNGSYFITAGYGKKGLGAGGINFNFRSSKINLYGNYGYTYDHTIESGIGFTQFSKGGNTITNNSFNDRDGKRQVHSARIGIDLQLDTATVIGALVGGYDNMWKMTAYNGASIQINNQVDTTINTVNNEINHWQNLMANLNFLHSFKPGKTLYFDVNYIYYNDNNPNTYTNEYYDKVKQFLYKDDLRSSKITPINVWVFSTDYTTPLGKKITMEAGAKVAFSKFTNDVSVDTFRQNSWVTDTSLSAYYLLKENIGAAYTSFTMNISDKTTMKAGLRYEYTYSNLGTTQKANIVDRKYGQLFPTFYISQKLSDNKSVNFSYSRRITRPTFNDLAPFTIFFDPKTFFTGNAALQPAIANTVQASYLLKNYIFSLSYTHEKNTIEGFQTLKVDTISNMLYLSAKNFTYEQYLTSSLSLPVDIKPWWAMQNNINLIWRQVNTTFNNSPVQLQIFNYNINTTQRFTLPKDFSIEFTALYSSASYFGSAKIEPVYQLNAGVQKKFSNGKDILRFAANDIFNSGTNYRYVEHLPIKSTIINGSLNFGLVAYKLTYTRNFGNNALKGKRDRSTGAEAELNRVRN